MGPRVRRDDLWFRPHENQRATLSAVIVRESGRSSIPETLMMESRGRGVLDRPVKPGDDNFL
jgi:hypothetical protein